MSVAAIILAAGDGSRFGGAKQLARLDGLTLLEHVVEHALAVPAIEDIVVVLGSRAEAITGAVELGPARVVHCAAWADGMSASLRAGVAALPPATEVALVLLADQPRITPQVIAMVMDGAIGAGPDVDAVRASYDGIPGHPVALGRALLRRVPELRGDTGARDLLRDARVTLVEAGHLCDPTDVDTPNDLNALEAITE
jgi:CTP:molybdopterin cytidylyltransferase MocA